MFPRTEKLVFNFDVPVKFFLSSESIKLKFSPVPAQNASVYYTILYFTILYFTILYQSGAAALPTRHQKGGLER